MDLMVINLNLPIKKKIEKGKTEHFRGDFYVYHLIAMDALREVLLTTRISNSHSCYSDPFMICKSEDAC